MENDENEQTDGTGRCGRCCAFCLRAHETRPDNAPQIGTANPASAFCEQQGGKSEIRKNEDGSEYGVCHLPDGSEVEEWEYYRANNQ